MPLALPEKLRVFSDAKAFAVKRAEGKPVTLAGYAMKWGFLSSDRGGYAVRLLKGSAKFTDPAHALYHHDYADVIGSTANGTLRFASDDTGLQVEIDLPDTQLGRDVGELVGKGYVGGMSFYMIDIGESREVKEDGQTILEISKFTASEVTVTAVPAFAQTEIGVRSFAQGRYSDAARDLARFESARFDLLPHPAL